MRGRDPHERHRAATPLELLYDLTLVVAFSIAGSQLAHALAAGHIWVGVGGFLFCMFAIVWAWQTFTWFASAYDTDDWGFRIATMVQMLGVTVLALGVGDLFAGLEQGRLDNRVIVSGYVIMRLSMMSLWLRAARNDSVHRPVLLGYVRVIGVAQIGWIGTALLPLSMPSLLALMAALYLLEIGGTAFVESKVGRLGLHVHHLAERYGLLAIITFGEVVLGTTTAVEALTSEAGWSTEAALLAFSGITMVVGMWWVYFALPHGQILARRRTLALRWSHVHLLIYTTIAGTGAGLHAVAYLLEHHSELGSVATTLAVAIPLALYILGIYLAFHLLLPGWDWFHITVIALTAAVFVLALALAALGTSIAWPILVLTTTPWITVVAYEARGHREMATRVRLLGQDARPA